MTITIDNDRLDAVNLKSIAYMLHVVRQQIYNNVESGMPRNADGTVDWPACCEWTIERKILAKQGEAGLRSYREGRLLEMLEADYDRDKRKKKTGTDVAWARQVERLRCALDRI